MYPAGCAGRLKDLEYRTHGWDNFESIAQATFWLISGRALFLLLHLLGLTCFVYIIWKRAIPLVGAQRDARFDHPFQRIGNVIQFWLGQWRHPRYRFAGTLHMLVFAGFLILIARAGCVLAMGVSDRFAGPVFGGKFGEIYSVIRRLCGHSCVPLHGRGGDPAFAVSARTL